MLNTKPCLRAGRPRHDGVAGGLLRDAESNDQLCYAILWYGQSVRQRRPYQRSKEKGEALSHMYNVFNIVHRFEYIC